MRREQTNRAIAIMALVSLCVGCGRSPTAPPAARPNAIHNLILSDPVIPIGPATAAVSGATTAATIVYVSMPPGSAAGGISAVIRNAQNGDSATTAMSNGGFDPVGIRASAGDTLLVDILGPGPAVVIQGYQVVTVGRRPVVVRTSPPARKADVPLNAIILAVFSSPMDGSTFNASTVQLLKGAAPVAGSVALVDAAGTRAEFTPATALDSGATYTLKIAQSVRSVTGLSLDSAVAVTFATAGSIGSSWSTRAPLPTLFPRVRAGVLNGLIYAVSGNSSTGRPGELSAYDPLADSWTSKAPMPITRGFSAVAAVSGRLYALGRRSDSIEVATLEAYDPATNTWATRTPMPTARVDMGVAVANGIIYAVGGSSGSAGIPTGILESYDPATDQWTTRKPMPTARLAPGVAVVNGILYVIGGSLGEADLDVATVEAYDPATDSWSTKSPLPAARGYMDVALLNGKLFAMGGAHNTFLRVSTVEVYDPATDGWLAGPDLVVPSIYPASAVVNGALYSINGDCSGCTSHAMEVLTP